MKNQLIDISKFQSLIIEHKSANHQLFDYIELAAKEGDMTEEMYSLFSVNIAVRTMLSLPEIHACCIQASLDLDPLRTAYSVMTGAEEGGFGRPTQVHTVLMMNALNYHGQIVFGLMPLNLKYFMALIRLIDSCRKYGNLIRIITIFDGIESDLVSSGFVDKEELIDIFRRTTEYIGIDFELEQLGNLDEIRRLENVAYEKLQASMVLQETIDYCIAQIAALGNMRTGYLQGVGFAHEGLADGMIYKMFRILYSQISRYPSKDVFMTHVYPYFSAHGNYIEVYDGISEYTEGVEVTHAQRELKKLSQLDSSALNVAWTGANDFADRNGRIWDGMLSILNHIKEPSITV